MTDLVAHSATADSPLEPPLSADATQGIAEVSLSPRQLAWRRYRNHNAAMVSTVIMGILVLFVVLAPLTARYGVNEAIFPATEKPNTYLSPFGDAWFGTDAIGRDLYSRLIYGTRVSLVIGLSSAIIGVAVGAAIGAFAALRGGWFDDLLMRVTDIFLAFPFLVSIIVGRNMIAEIGWLKPIFGDKSSLRFVVLLLAIFGWMGVARVVRGQVLALKEREFIEAERAIGAKNRRIILQHLMPNAIGPILVALSLSVVAAISAEATLGFFGFGPQLGDGSTSLGNLVGDAKENVLNGNWWMAVFPCAVLIVVTVTISFIGDGLRDATDPKMLIED